MMSKYYLLILIFESASRYSMDYNPSCQFDQCFFEYIDKALDVYSTYERVLINGDFKAQEYEKCLDIFFDT